MLESCTSNPITPTVTPEAPDRCRLQAGAAGQAETLTVAWDYPAPAPRNSWEGGRLLFRGFDTLVRLDCEDHVRPALANAWNADSTGRVWTFSLSDQARRGDGSKITAGDIVAAWEASRAISDSMGLESAVALDERRVAVTLTAPSSSAPAILAHSAFALATRPAPDSPVLQTIASGDPRDALDQGVDLLVTYDPALVDYVAKRPEFTSVPLPWSRTYVLLVPAGAEPLVAFYPDSIDRSLARDAVRADARPAESPFWWSGPESCRVLQSLAATPSPAPRIVYPRGDDVARGLAERIVALAHGPGQPRTAALESGAFAAALQSGGDLGYIVSLPRRSLSPCRESAALPPGARISPLIDTRAHAIIRRGTPPLTVEWDGTIRLPRETPRKAELP